MNPSQGAHLTSQHASDPSERDLSPTELPTVSPVNRRDPPARPSLTRLPPGRLSEISSTSPGSNDDVRSAGADATGNDAALSASKQGDDRGPSGGQQTSSTEAERLSRVKDAVNAKLMAQQRKRGSYGPSTSPAASRVSPITEEGIPSLSPSLAAAFASPGDTMRPLSTVSTESTESSRTVRASVPSTPAESRALRTPSYPFPIVPGSARPWQSPLHQPFTGLSPTGLADFSHASDNHAGRASISSMVSTASTPVGNTSNFLPPDTRYQGPEDPRFPTPNLYDAVLQLNTEPGMDQWWNTVTNLMHDHFQADRVTLAVPLDPTDIENVPWGQKATFNMCGREEFVSRRKLMEQQTIVASESSQDIADNVRDAPTEAIRDTQMRKLHPERLRPRLDSRHSYAGHGRETKDHSTDPSARVGTRPLGLQRTVTLAASTASDAVPGRGFIRGHPSSGPSRMVSSSDPEFSSVAGGVDAGPYTEVFSALQGLDHEAHPLIEPGGVSRVLERGRVVTITRDYSLEDDASDEKSTTTEVRSQESTRKPAGATNLGNEKVFGASYAASALEASSLSSREYQEYEQYPMSPWAQSPAPSPAIQSDEEDNPFFAAVSTEQVEDSFNPTSTPKDYATYGQVEAIGIDRASTVIHIPLVHPALSPPMYSRNVHRHPDDRPGMPQRSNTIDPERKAPVAILSVLSPNVPYPDNLMNSIKLLGPHLATSFTTAQQFTSTFQQALSHHQQPNSQGYSVWTGSMMMERSSIANIMHAEPEHAQGSVNDSVTSPSDYSGRSHNSPSSSIVGTPGWDPASHGWTASRSAAATPYSGTEIVENYFDAHKRSAQRRGSVSSSHPLTVSTSGRLPKNPSGSDSGSSGTKSSSHDSDEQVDRHGEHKSKVIKSALEHPSIRDVSAPPSSPKRSSGGLPSNIGTGITSRHTLLHSYGANLASTFGADSATSGAYASEGAHAEDMPPPSERLLRTIIDSVPVQIFTATPNTGQLSWVNSKYLIYRGQEPRQVLQEPWDSIHPEDRVDFLAVWNRSLRTAQQLQQKVRLKRFDGAFRWFYVRAAPLKDKRQKIVHWIGTMMDFHDQHLAETTAARQLETEASEAKYRALANSSPQIVFAVSRARGITFCNSQWVQYSGQTEAEALGAGFMSYVNPDDLVKCRLPTFDDASQQPTNVPTSLPFAPRRSLSASAASSSGSSETERADVTTSPIGQMPQRQLSELASTGILKVTRDADGRPSYSTEVRLKSRDGDFRWHLVRVLLAEATSSANTEETWYGTCTDINDHKTLERDLKETMDEKSRFLSNMSHEIRTPLNGITGMVNFLIDSSLTPEQMEHVSIIRASTEGLRGLINDILDLSKAEAGMIQLKMDWLYVRAILEEVNDLTSAMAIDKGLELNYLVEEDVPSQVKGDRFRLRQILLNVIGNAIKFTQKGEVFVRCSVMPNDNELNEDETYIRFEVIDTGRGFTDREAEFLFKRFSQIDGSSTRQHGGTGLGLVISRQLAQLHGGDMLAKAIPGKGSTFTFIVKVSLPSEQDQSSLPPLTPGTGLPQVPILPGPSGSSSTLSRLTKVPSVSERMQLQDRPKYSPKSTVDHKQSPLGFMSPDHFRESPGASSASSEPSVRSEARTASLRSSSTRSSASASSSVSEAVFANSQSMSLSLPAERKSRHGSSSSNTLGEANQSSKSSSLTPKIHLGSPTSGQLSPPMSSILVVCPLKYSREATVQHIDMTLPKNIPHQITARENLLECQKMLGGSDPVIFTHVVVVLQDVGEITALMDQVFSSHAHHSTTVVIITDLAQRRKIVEQAPQHDYEKLNSEQRLRFVFKPLKPSRFAIIFDPRKEREMSTDRNQDSAQQVALNQKQVFEKLAHRLGNKDKRVLLVEDNKINQMVVLQFLAKVSIKAETAMDGVQCTDKLFAQPHGHYSIILCDLHMPNKDGYQTCKEIRTWERQNRLAHLPIIALSANVLGDVYQKCVDAGFNSYMTKPVDFNELSTMLMTFMDPSDPSKPHEFMKLKRGQAAQQKR